MAPTAGFLAKSESKKRFFERLGLDERNKLHRQLYSSMKKEAVEGWSRISANRDALIPALRNEPVEPPFTFGQIDEEAVHAEVLHIFKNARKDTKIMYQLGRDYDGDMEQNWIIRWLLWHVFRYRDDRNVGASRKRTARNSEEADTVSNAASDTRSPTETAEAAISHVSASTRRYRSAPSQQLVSPQQQPQVSCNNAIATATPTLATSASTRYFDPVRDSFRT